MYNSIGKDDVLVSVEEFVMQKCFEIDWDADGDNDRFSSVVDGGGWQVRLSDIHTYIHTYIHTRTTSIHVTVRDGIVKGRLCDPFSPC